MFDGVLQDLIDELSYLPSIGPKSASRLAFYLLNAPNEKVEKLADTLSKLKKQVFFCEICGNITANKGLCLICKDESRNNKKICVVATAKDIETLEKTNEYKGLYHVLGGLINPIQGIGPDNLRIKELYKRLSDSNVDEVIIALDPNIEGEATTTYLARTLKSMSIKVSRLASGLPIGGDLEFADELTLSRAIELRVEL